MYVVLREVVDVERPPAPPAPPSPRPEQEAAPRARPVPQVAVRTSREPSLPDAGSMLATLALATESDERPVLRRVAALLVLMTITLATAALVGAGIYRAVAGLD